MRTNPLVLAKIVLITVMLLATQLNASRMVEVTLIGSNVEVSELLLPSLDALAPEDYDQPFEAFSNSDSIRVKVYLRIRNEDTDKFYNGGFHYPPTFDYHEIGVAWFDFFNGDGEFAGGGWGGAINTAVTPTYGDIDGDGYLALGWGNWHKRPNITTIGLFTHRIGPKNNELHRHIWTTASQGLLAELTSVTYHVPDSSGPATLCSFLLLFAFNAKYRKKRNQ